MFGPIAIELLKFRLRCWLGIHEWSLHRFMGHRFCMRCNKWSSR